MSKLEDAKRVFDIEITALMKTKEELGDTFLRILDMIVDCEGKVIITGMGKSGHIASKIAATFASLGTPSFYLNPAEALHGDLGMISPEDIIIAISFSGESDEITRIIPSIKVIGAKLVGITGNESSVLARAADVVQVFPDLKEACSMGLAPTTSTTVALCYGDALAVAASISYGFSEKRYALLHPAGSLGKRLILKVEDIMSKDEMNAVISEGVPLKDAIVELSKKGLGAVTVVDKNNLVIGIVTDGDLRRQLERGVDIYSLKVNDVMTSNPVKISKEALAVEALDKLKKKNISCLVVTDMDKVVGTIRLQDIIRSGIVM